MSPVVYETMNGPSESTVTGRSRDWDVFDRLGEIQVPTLITGPSKAYHPYASPRSPLVRSSSRAFSDFSRPLSPIPSRTAGALLNWMSR